MATLSQHVQDRYGEQYLVNLTNPYEQGYTTLDTDRLDFACDDATGLFEIHAQQELDLDNKSHVVLAVRLVEALLLQRTGVWSERGNSSLDSLLSALRELAEISVRDRVGPRSTAERDDYPGKVFDRGRFGDFIPRPPQHGAGLRYDPGALD